MRRLTIPRMAGQRATSEHRAVEAAAELALGTVTRAFASVMVLAMVLVLVLVDVASAQTNSNGFFTGGASRLPRDQQAFGKANGRQIAGPVRKGDKATPLYLNADEIEYDTRNNRVIARGNVEIYYNNYALTADRVVYDQTANTITAEGNAKVREPDGAIVSAERLVTTADFAEAFVETLSVIGKDDSRIVGVRAVRRDGNVTVFVQGKFTPCKSDPGKPPLWCIAAERVTHDKEKATITYQDAWFEVLGVPVLYTPYFQHADPSVKSKSGFLMPEYSSYTRLGTGIEVPYHFALNPSYDFLFNPMYLSKQGVLYQGEWRQRLRIGDSITGTYNIKLAGIDQNNDQTINASLHDRWRGSIQSRGTFSLSSWWAFGWDVIGETDKTFRQFYRLDNILQKDRVNTFYVSGRSDRNYFGLTMYHVGGLVLNERLDTLPPGVLPSSVAPSLSQSAPSRVAPVVDYNYVFANPIVGGELRFNANAVAYWQDLTFVDSSGIARRADSNAHRATAALEWRRTLIDPIGQTFTPFVQARGDIINFRETVNPLNLTLQQEETVARGVGSAGLLYAYPWVASTTSATHTIEPVGQVVARNASVDQRRLPDIDCRSQVFSDENLFEWSKSGCFDRIDTGVRANYGLQYTLQANNGGSLRLLAGQSQHISGDNIFRNPGVDSDNRLLYSPASGLERRSSDYVLGLYVSPLSGLRSVTQARFDEQTKDLKRLDSLVGANYGPIISQVSYAFTAASPALNLRQDQQELLAMLGLRLTENWSISGQTRYSIDANRPLQNIAQLKYADECYVMTANYIETHLTDPTRDIRPDRTILFRFELKYLGEFRYKTTVLDHVFGDNVTAPR